MCDSGHSLSCPQVARIRTLRTATGLLLILRAGRSTLRWLPYRNPGLLIKLQPGIREVTELEVRHANRTVHHGCMDRYKERRRTVVDPSYLKNTAETDHLTSLLLEQLMTAYPDAVAVNDLAAAIGKSRNRLGHYFTRIRERFRIGDVPLTVTVQNGTARLCTRPVIGV